MCESKERTYLCIDLKSFFASVECVVRGWDPFKVKLVVADPTRGQGAITLAASPAIKELGVKSRGRIFEIPKHIEYEIATPRMTLYMKYATMIHKIFLKYVSCDDIHVYSIDESFLDVTSYLSLYKMSGVELAKKIIASIYEETKITATAGIGTNLFLAKIALDVTAKHSPNSIGYLNEELFKKTLWHHKPLTDFWMIGKGTVNRLAKLNIYDLYGITRCPEKYLYDIFGVNARFLIDHAWGKESTTIADIKRYKPKANSISNSQILFEDYNCKDAYLIMKEMVETNVLSLTEKHLVTDHIALTIGYSKDVIKASHGSRKITNCTNSYKILLEEFKLLYKKIVDPRFPIRQISVSFGNVKDELYEQFDLFVDIEEVEREKRVQLALVDIRKKYGKNAILKGMNLLDKATARKRNTLVGGHNAV